MNLRPANRAELSAGLRAANGRREPIGSVDLGAMNRILQHTPEDMTVTVEAGMVLADLQSALARSGQWLPIDPPHPDRLTVAALLAGNWSGPRRFAFGTIRDHLIGLEVALADGRLVRSGGKVVKNVAGYDLLKLFVGAHDSLGLVVEATFKLLPRPAAEQFVQVRCPSLDECRRRIDAVLDSDLTPSVLDVHNIGADGPVWHVVAGFSGTQEEVDWQIGRAAGLGFGESCTLNYDETFRAPTLPAPHRLSVLPSRLAEALGELAGKPFVARAGNGVIYHRAAAPVAASAPPSALARRAKDIFDPNHILPGMPA